MSSYDELVQLPISATEIASTKPRAGSSHLGSELRDRARAIGRVRADHVRLERATGRARARDRSARSGCASTSRIGLEQRLAVEPRAARARRVPSRADTRPCARRQGNSDVVAPSSAPMLAIVALPVALRVRAPGPMYSTIALVPPETVSWPATQRITSLGAAPAAELAGENHGDPLAGRAAPRAARPSPRPRPRRRRRPRTRRARRRSACASRCR